MKVVWVTEGTITAKRERLDPCVDCFRADALRHINPQVCGVVINDTGASSLYGMLSILEALNGRKVRITIEVE